jgi:hypothetical protein
MRDFRFNLKTSINLVIAMTWLKVVIANVAKRGVWQSLGYLQGLSKHQTDCFVPRNDEDLIYFLISVPKW